MKKYVCLAAFIIAATSCKKERISGSGPTTTETRSLSGFDEIVQSGTTGVSVAQDSNFEVKVKAYANLLPYLETKLSNSKLLIGYKSHTNISNDNSEVYIRMPRLTGLSASGSGDIAVTGNFISEDFNASTSGSGNIHLPDGTVDNLTIRVMGSGDVKGFGFVAQNADITIQGSGDVEVHVIQRLKVTIQGSGNVYYKGTPADINTRFSGSGQLIKR